MSDLVGITVVSIKAAVCAEFKTNPTTLVSECREPRIVRPRQVAMYLTRRLTGISFPGIGKRFGNRDPATVIHSVNRIATLMKADPELSERVTAIEARLTATQNGEHY